MDTRSLIFVFAAFAVLTLAVAVPSRVAWAGQGCQFSAGAVGNGYAAAGTCSAPGSSSAGDAQPVASITHNGKQPTYEWRLACGNALTGTQQGGAQPCAGSTGCPPKQHLYRLWEVTPTVVPMGIQCAADTPKDPAPKLTAAMVARAFQHVPLPGLVTHVQPKDKTLVDFDTIFYTDAQPITRTVTLLGQQVRLQITPSRFTWSYGDGSEQTTSGPGAPYPSKEVTHRYPHAHTTVAAHVSVTWTAEYSVNGGGLQPVDGTVTTTGPDTGLRIAEAVPALSGAGH